MEDQIHYCKYCQNIATHQFKNGTWCCSQFYTQCPIKRKEFSERQRGEKNHAFGKPTWNKGLTTKDPRVAVNISRMQQTKIAHPHTAWNKGLTIEDPRVAAYAAKCSKTKKGQPNYKNRKPLSQSRGKCISHFRNRFKQGLYTEWIFPILQRDHFTCVLCKESKVQLEVHHLYPYTKIFDDALQIVGLSITQWLVWTEEQILNLHTVILQLHLLEIGITVCSACHGKIDSSRQKFLERRQDGKIPRASK